MLSEHLKQSQIYGLIGLSTIYWTAAALKIRYAGHIFYANNLWRVASFASAIPITYTAMLISEALLGISPSLRVTSTVITSMVALMMDGVAFMWFPSLYENPSIKKKNPQLAVALSRMGAAWILFGVGASFAVALLTEH